MCWGTGETAHTHVIPKINKIISEKNRKKIKDYKYTASCPVQICKISQYHQLLNDNFEGAVVKKDIGAFCCDVLRILEHAQATKQRVTPLKLLDAWQGKGATSLRERSVRPPRLSRFDCERIVAYMLLHSYLREDFHFTPYSTISYLLPGM